MPEQGRDSNFTDAFIWSLTFSVVASILDLYQHLWDWPDGGSIEWQG